ncbi:MAG TPA: class II aldolase/adducin family protein [Kofleriaceae bacterium]|jgi:ribulose-5-phosphate 4-epimerase/fuculose-1-phosphate aldolase
MIDRSVAIQIAIAGRVLAQAGLAANLGNHLSVVHEGRIHVNAFGRSLAALRPSDVVVVDGNGKVIEGSGRVNDTILLHSVLHELVPTAAAIVHTHAPNILTAGTLRVIPEVYDQESTLLAEDVAIHDEEYEGPTDRAERIAPLARVLQSVNAVLLPNHGALTAGKSLFLATLRMLRLEAMAKRHLELHVTAAALGRTPRPTDRDVAVSTRDSLNAMADRHNVGELYWRDWIEQVKRVDPSFDTAGFLD